MRTWIYVALNFPESPGKALLYAKHVATCMSGNAYFPTPIVPMATFLAEIAELETAEVATLTGAHGTATERNSKLSDVHNTMKRLRADIETTANQPGVDGPTVVASSGMSVKDVAGPSKADFAVKPGNNSGSVELSARHPGRGTKTSFDWQSSDDHGAHWVDAPRTVYSYTTISGLTPGVLYSFRYRTLTRDGEGDWSDPITLMVV
jgi:hypothetical protein